MLLPDGERWICQYDEELDDYFWVPLPPLVLPTDAVVLNPDSWTAPDGVIHHVRPRLEWINSTLYSGADVHLRKPLTTAFSIAANWVAVWSRVWAHDGTDWAICRESGWVHSTAAGSSWTPTFNWGKRALPGKVVSG